MVDIVLTPDQLAAIRRASGPVNFVTSARELVCVSQLPAATSTDTEFHVGTDCEPLSLAEIEEISRRIRDEAGMGITTEQLLQRLEQRRGS